MALTPVQSRAREKVWLAQQTGVSITLTADEAHALWETILIDGREKLRAQAQLQTLRAKLGELVKESA